MRLVALVVAVAAIAVVPALAADGSVKTTAAARFDPDAVTVAVGEKVTWTNDDGGFHNVHFEDGFESPASPSTSWPSTVERTFTQAGDYAYYCEFHKDSGMLGTVHVTAPAETPGATPSATATAVVTPTPTPTPTPALGTTPAPTATPAGPATPTFAVTAAKRFCLMRSARCRRPGIALRISATGPIRITGRLYRGTRRAGVLVFAVRAGSQTVRFSRRTTDGRRLRPGRHRLVLEAPGVARTVRFTLRAR